MPTTRVPTAVPRLRVARLASGAGRVDELLSWLAAPPGTGSDDDASVRARLRGVVPEYTHDAGA